MSLKDNECKICGSTFTVKIYSRFPGFVEGTCFDIFKCSICDTQFVLNDKSTSEIYDAIYSQDTWGYERYHKYAEIIKQQLKPLKFLSEKEAAYYAVYEYLRCSNKTKKILEVGCGLGYLTYSLKKSNHEVLGIDISKNAIEFAKGQFGNYYVNVDLKDLDANEKFDLIIATELIEHLPNPLQFLEMCKKHLKNDGTILLTTPNYNKNKIWNTDLPPIHMFWFSKKSFAALSKSCDLDLSFINFNRFVSKNDLLAFLPRISLPGSTLDTELKAVQTEAIFNSTLRQIVTRFAYCNPIRYVSHYIYRLISAEYPLLGVILTKK